MANTQTLTKLLTFLCTVAALGIIATAVIEAAGEAADFFDSVPGTAADALALEHHPVHHDPNPEWELRRP